MIPVTVLKVCDYEYFTVPTPPFCGLMCLTRQLCLQVTSSLFGQICFAVSETLCVVKFLSLYPFTLSLCNVLMHISCTCTSLSCCISIGKVR